MRHLLGRLEPSAAMPVLQRGRYALVVTEGQKVAITFRGNTYAGEFVTEGNVLEVSFAGMIENRIFRGSDPELHARLLLIEMVARLSSDSGSARKS